MWGAPRALCQDDFDELHSESHRGTNHATDHGHRDVHDLDDRGTLVLFYFVNCATRCVRTVAKKVVSTHRDLQDKAAEVRRERAFARIGIP